MKNKFTIALIIMNIILLIVLIIVHVSIKDKNVIDYKYLHVKKMHCIANRDNVTDRNLYAYISEYGKVYKTVFYVEETFNTLDEYQYQLEYKNGLVKDYDNIVIVEDRNNLKLTTEETTELANYISLNQFIKKMKSKYNCEYLEFYN